LQVTVIQTPSFKLLAHVVGHRVDVTCEPARRHPASLHLLSSSTATGVLDRVAETPAEKLAVELLGHLLRRIRCAVKHDLGALRCLERTVDPGEVADLPATGPGIEALGVTRFTDLQRRINIDLGELDIAGHLACE